MDDREPFRPPNKRAGKKAAKKRQLFELTQQGKHCPKVKSKVLPRGIVDTSDVVDPITSAGSSTSRVAPVPPPKAPGVVTGFVDSAFDSEAPTCKAESEVVVAKAKAGDCRLSQEVNPILRPGTTPVRSPAVTIQAPTVRLSLDLHGVLDIDAPTEGRWGIEARTATANWLTQSHYHEVGVCSFIGERGELSQQRRKQAKSEVVRFNTDYHRDLRICITSDRSKEVLQADTVSCHIDDRKNLCDELHSRGVPVVCLNEHLFRNKRLVSQCPYPVVPNIVQAFEAINRFRLVPRVFSEWPGIFTTPLW